MTAAPPVLAGALQLRTDCPFSFDVAAKPVGALGTVAGVAVVDADVLVPAALVAVTVKVYNVPFVNPVTVAVYGPVPVIVPTVPLGLDVTV